MEGLRMKELKTILNTIADKTIVGEPFYSCEIKKYFVTTEEIFESIKQNCLIDEYSEFDSLDVKPFLKETVSFGEKNVVDLFERLHKHFSLPNTLSLKKLIAANGVLHSKECYIIEGEKLYVDVEYAIHIERISIVEYDKTTLLNAIEAYTNTRIYEHNFG
jgi:hypothetical protein